MQKMHKLQISSFFFFLLPSHVLHIIGSMKLLRLAELMNVTPDYVSVQLFP